MPCVSNWKIEESDGSEFIFRQELPGTEKDLPSVCEPFLRELPRKKFPEIVAPEKREFSFKNFMV